MVLLAAATMALGLSACGSSDKDKGGAATAASGPTAKASAIPSSAVDWAVQYTGGKAAKADASLAPVVIGYTNQQGGAVGYPNNTAGAQAAVKFINGYLGGIGGHPVALSTCYMKAEEDGARCGGQFVNDKKVSVVMKGEAVVGTSLYKTIGSKKAVLVASAGIAEDYTTPGVSVLGAGPVGPVAGQAAYVIQRLKAKNIGVLFSNNPGGKSVVDQLLKPTFAAAHVTAKYVGIADSSTAPQVNAALQALDIGKIQALVTVVLAPQCVATANALKSLGSKVPVVTSYLCYDAAVEKSLGHFPDGIYLSGATNPYVKGAADTDTYVSAMKALGGGSATFSGDGPQAFTTMMTIAKFGNQIGVDKITPATMSDAIAKFAGPMMLAPGPMACGYNKSAVGLCGRFGSVSQVQGGTWSGLPPIKVG